MTPGQLGQLYRAAHGRRGRQKLVAMIFEAYSDESIAGEGECEVFALATLIAPASVWESFEDAWARAMERGGAAGKILHMRELVHGVGQFKGWSNEAKTNLLKKLVPVFQRHVTLGIVGAVAVEAHNAHMAPFAINSSDELTPYLMLLQGVMEQIVERVHVGKDSPVACFFERNDEHESDVLRQFYHASLTKKLEHVFQSATFLAKDVAAPFQAADMVAYEWARYCAEHQLGKSTRKRRELLTALDRTKRLTFGFASPEDLRRHAGEFQEQRVYYSERPEEFKELARQFTAAEKRMQREHSGSLRKKLKDNQR